VAVAWRLAERPREELVRRILEQARAIEHLRQENERLRRDRERIERERDRLRDDLEAARRRGCRRVPRRN